MFFLSIKTDPIRIKYRLQLGFVLMEAKILRLNHAGQPLEWIHWQEAVNLYAREIVAWTLGDVVREVVGGYCRVTGKQSRIELPSIIASVGSQIAKPRTTYPLTNRALFARDQHLCLYCGKEYGEAMLTRDHIVPTSRGGKDSWENVVAACRRCNQHKGNYLLQETHMELLAMPYRPNLAEYLALVSGRRIRTDQMAFLSAQFSKNYRACRH